MFFLLLLNSECLWHPFIEAILTVHSQECFYLPTEKHQFQRVFVFDGILGFYICDVLGVDKQCWDKHKEANQ